MFTVPPSSPLTLAFTPPCSPLYSPLMQEPPSFLLPGQLIEIELAKQVKVQVIQPEEESITSQIVDTTPPPASENVFDSTFGRSVFTEGFDFQPQPPKKDERSVV